jgi:hypothetical protein
MKSVASPLIRLFVISAGALLLASALTHLLNAVGSAQILGLPDPVLGTPLRYALLAAGALELTAALLCLFGKRLNLQLSWLAWLATNLLVYRLGLRWSDCNLQCTALGYPTDPLHISPAAARLFLSFTTIYLVLGSYPALLWQWLHPSKDPALQHSSTPSLKMSCPGCGVHIEFATENLGQKIPCPRCRASVTLRKPDLLKMACFFCKEHIEFPPHAIGQKIHCPHCRIGITLKEPA